MKKALISMMLFLVFCVGANAQYKIAKQVVGSGGFVPTQAGVNYKAAGVFGQAFVGTGNAGKYTAYLGFWTPDFNTVSVDDDSNVNIGINNYPNPVTSSTEFKFELKEAGYVTLNIYNNVGSLVARVVQDKFMQAGTNSIEWSVNSYLNNETINSGSYMYELNVVPGTGNNNAKSYTYRNMMIISK